MRRLLFLATVAMAMVLSAHGTARADMQVYNETVSGTFYGCTEQIAATGTEHWTIQEAHNAQGTYSYISHVNYQDVTGIGMTTGIHYQLVGVTNASGADTPAGGSSDQVFGTSANTQVSSVRWIAQGSAPDSQGLMVSHFTFDADGIAVSSTFVSKGCLP